MFKAHGLLHHATLGFIVKKEEHLKIRVGGESSGRRDVWYVLAGFRGTSILRTRHTLRPYSIPIPSRALRWSWGGGGVLMSEAPLYVHV